MKPSIAFLGVGDYGARFAARLIAANHDVTVLARGETFHRLHAEGLRIPAGPFQPEPLVLPDVRATDDPSTAGEVDYLIISVKLYQLDQACRDALPLIGPKTTVVPLCNGVDAPDRCAKHFGAEKVIGASTGGPMAIGEWPRGRSDRTELISDVFADSNIRVRHHASVIEPIWHKFAIFAGNAPVCAVSRQNVGGVSVVPELVELSMQATREITALAKRVGISDTDSDLVAMERYWREMNPEFQPSMLKDILAGRPLELDAACRTVINLGAMYGTSTPANSFLYAALLPFENGGEVPGK